MHAKSIRSALSQPYGLEVFLFEIDELLADFAHKMMVRLDIRLNA